MVQVFGPKASAGRMAFKSSLPKASRTDARCLFYVLRETESSGRSKSVDTFQALTRSPAQGQTGLVTKILAGPFPGEIEISGSIKLFHSEQIIQHIESVY